MSFQITKFGASNEVKLLFCPGLEVHTRDVSGPGLQTIQFRKEDQQLDTSEGDYSRVYTLRWYVGEVPTGDDPSFVPSVMLHVVDRDELDLLVPLRRFSALSSVLKDSKLLEALHFLGFGFSPLVVAILLVQEHGF